MRRYCYQPYRNTKASKIFSTLQIPHIKVESKAHNIKSNLNSIYLIKKHDSTKIYSISDYTHCIIDLQICQSLRHSISNLCKGDKINVQNQEEAESRKMCTLRNAKGSRIGSLLQPPTPLPKLQNNQGHSEWHVTCHCQVPSTVDVLVTGRWVWRVRVKQLPRAGEDTRAVTLPGLD